MSKTETSISNLKINRGTYAKIQENLSSIGENELIITTDKTVPVPTTTDSGKVIKVNASGEYELGTDNDTTYSTATTSTAGLVKLASGTAQSVSANAVTSTASRTYAVQLNSSSQMVVNVPWSDTTYSLSNTSNSGLLRALNSSSVTTQTQSTKFLREDGTWAAPSYSTGAVQDVQVNGTSVLSSGIANIVTNTAYNASSNKIATMSDVPSGELDINFNDVSSTVTTTTPLTNVTLVGDTRYTVVSTSETAASGGSTLSLVTTGEKYTWNGKQNALTTSSVSSGTVAEAIGFDSSNNLVRGAVGGGGMTNPMTTQGDIIIGGASGTPTRLPKGTAGQVLTMNSGATGAEWQTPSGGGGGGSNFKNIVNIYMYDNGYVGDTYIRITFTDNSVLQFTDAVHAFANTTYTFINVASISWGYNQNFYNLNMYYITASIPAGASINNNVLTIDTTTAFNAIVVNVALKSENPD